MESSENRRAGLEEQLQRLTEKLEREMRARGFDPSQVENIALPGPLAKLYLDRESLAAELEEIKRGDE